MRREDIASDLKASPSIECDLAEKSRRYNFVNIDQGEPAMLNLRLQSEVHTDL